MALRTLNWTPQRAFGGALLPAAVVAGERALDLSSGVPAGDARACSSLLTATNGPHSPRLFLTTRLGSALFSRQAGRPGPGAQQATPPEASGAVRAWNRRAASSPERHTSLCRFIVSGALGYCRSRPQRKDDEAIADSSQFAENAYGNEPDSRGQPRPSASTVGRGPSALPVPNWTP